MVGQENRMDVKTLKNAQPLAGVSPYPEEDEISLLDLLITLTKHKALILCITFFAGVIAVFYSLQMPNIYKSEATIAPREGEKSSSSALSALGGLGGIVAEGLGLGGGGSLKKLDLVLNSRNLTARVIEKYKLMPILFSNLWDQNKKLWKIEDPPTLQDGCKAMKSILIVNVDSTNGTLELGIEHEDPQIAKKFVEYYLAELSEALREEVLRDAAENMRFFNEQLERTDDPLMKEKIYSMLAREIEKDTFARAQKYYSFIVLDPPIVPDLNKRIKPKRRNICVLSVAVAFFVAVFLAFLKEYIHHLKTEDPERYQEVVQGLKFWKKYKGS
jgi:uncharacterized protein involved in exopolysaccharide biosynthesis